MHRTCQEELYNQTVVYYHYMHKQLITSLHSSCHRHI